MGRVLLVHCGLSTERHCQVPLENGARVAVDVLVRPPVAHTRGDEDMSQLEQELSRPARLPLLRKVHPTFSHYQCTRWGIQVEQEHSSLACLLLPQRVDHIQVAPQPLLVSRKRNVSPDSLRYAIPLDEVGERFAMNARSLSSVLTSVPSTPAGAPRSVHLMLGPRMHRPLCAVCCSRRDLADGWPDRS